MEFMATRDITGADIFGEFARPEEVDQVFVKEGEVGTLVYETDHSWEIDFLSQETEWSFNKTVDCISEVK